MEIAGGCERAVENRVVAAEKMIGASRELVQGTFISEDSKATTSEQLEPPTSPAGIPPYTRRRQPWRHNQWARRQPVISQEEESRFTCT